MDRAMMMGGLPSQSATLLFITLRCPPPPFLLPQVSNPPLSSLEGEAEVNGGPAWTPVVSSQIASAKYKVRGGRRAG